MNPRTTIRNALRDQLEALATAAPATYPRLADAAAREVIFAARSLSLYPAQMPAVAVYTTAERIDAQGPNNLPGVRRRVLDVIVECWAVGGEGMDPPEEVVDDMAFEVEAALDADHTLGMKCEAARFQIVTIDDASQGEHIVFVAVMEIEVSYWTREEDGAEDDPSIPSILMLGTEPRTGLENEPAYVQIVPEYVGP